MFNTCRAQPQFSESDAEEQGPSQAGQGDGAAGSRQQKDPLKRPAGMDSADDNRKRLKGAPMAAAEKKSAITMAKSGVEAVKTSKASSQQEDKENQRSEKADRHAHVVSGGVSKAGARKEALAALAAKRGRLGQQQSHAPNSSAGRGASQGISAAHILPEARLSAPLVEAAFSGPRERSVNVDSQVEREEACRKKRRLVKAGGGAEVSPADGMPRAGDAGGAELDLLDDF